MAGDGKRITAAGQDASRPTGARAIDALLTMDGPPERFLTELLASQCRNARADAAMLLRGAAADQIEVLAAYPTLVDPDAYRSWIDSTSKPFGKAMQSGETVIVRDKSAAARNGGPQRYLMVLPIGNQGGVRAAAAFRIRAQRREKLLLSRARLETTALLLHHRELKLSMNLHREASLRLQGVLEVLDMINRPQRFLESAMALCNEIATRFDCSRVSLGVLKGRCVHLRAMSHTDSFSRRMQVVQAIETAMEECVDQDLEVRHPAGDAARVVTRAAAALSENHGPSAVLSLPIRQAGDVTAVVTLERRPASPFAQLGEIEAIRLICDLIAPRLLDMHLNDRWLGARLMSGARTHMGRLLGHEHTWLKLGAAMICLLGLLGATLKAEYRIKAPFTFKAQHQQAVVAPFDTFAKRVLVEPGDRVEGGQTLLGTLDTAELRLKLAALKAEQLGYKKRMTSSMRDRNTAEAQMAMAQSDKVAARIRMIETRIEQARLVAPISGWVVSEDRKQQIGAPVESGEILFEIMRIDSLRAELHVPEALIADIAAGQSGTLASVGHPEKKIRFTIERINPIAEVVDHQNVFRCRARIDEHLEWMRPGMEGEARISAGEQTYLWMATRGLVNWLRMKLWI